MEGLDLKMEGFSKDLVALVAQMLATDPEERPSVDAVLRSPYIQAWMENIITTNADDAASENASQELGLR